MGASERAGDLRIVDPRCQDVELVLLERDTFQLEVIRVGSHGDVRIADKPLATGSSRMLSSHEKLTIGDMTLQFRPAVPSRGFPGNFIVACGKCNLPLERMDHLINADAAWLCERCSGERQVTQRLGSFDVVGKIGEGDWWEVHEAIQQDTGLRAAVKKPKSPGSREVLKQFIEREQRMAHHLRHPRIVAHYGAGEHEGTLYAAFEYMSEGSIARLWDPKLRLEDVLVIAQDVFLGLDYLHELGILHRELAPSNVLLRRRAGRLRAKLSDFGLAKSMADFGPTWPTWSAAEDQERQAGARPFMSPSRRAKEEAKQADDLYGAGLVVYWLLTGRTPQGYAGSKLGERESAMLEDAFQRNKHVSLKDASKRFGELPRELVELVDGLTHPTDRMRYKEGITAHAIERLGWLLELLRRAQ
ncbi:protein kinase domain-containing protein [Polyangium sorediatum]|uniref:non-specific serine/threonine protein kinase n=1 Tax=Polyangium sorediatum TaxID=889274 RepID=A0ABT6NS17_9BACT|nr:protein kinase [Polyangium sorediatum]MDI1431108.1 protein kinase [Polyangium sorediatum]